MAERGKLALIVGYLLTCFFFAVRLIIPYFIIIGLGGNVSVADVMYIQLFITLVSYFSPTPGASGIAEVSSLVLMAALVAVTVSRYLYFFMEDVYALCQYYYWWNIALSGTEDV